MMYLADSQATEDLAKRFAVYCHAPLVVYFFGHLGAGKTTFIRGFLQAKGIADRIKSPTFTLVEPYSVNEQPFFHFDLYRLTDPEELLLIGIEDYFTDDSICLIEWPEQGASVLPAADLEIQLEIDGQGRRVEITAVSKKGGKILAELTINE